MMTSTVIGANLGFFSYHVLKLKLYWYVAAPLAASVWFLSRNLIMKNCVDRIYYAGEHIYNQYRQEDLYH